MHVLALCAGIGGLELGIKLATGNAARTVCICEGEAYCASVLRARMQDGSLDDCPIWSDVRTFDPGPWRGKVDCITAGYPCQPFSTAGRRKGAADPRHLWPYIAGHIRVLRPRYVFCENVPGHLSMGFEQVCEDLCGMGYSIEAGIFSAAEVGAPHLRKRLFFVAYTNGVKSRRLWRGTRARDSVSPENTEGDGQDRHMADTDGPGQWRPVRRQIEGRDETTQPLGGCADVADTDGARLRAWQCCQSGPVRHETRRAQPERRSGDVADAQHGRRRPKRTAGKPLGGQDDGLHSSGPQNCGGSGCSCADVADYDGSGCGQGCTESAIHVRRDGINGGGFGINSGSRAIKRQLGEFTPRNADLVDHLARGWPADWENGVPRVATGQPHRIDRLRALGNAVVPQTAALAWTTLMQQAVDCER